MIFLLFSVLFCLYCLVDNFFKDKKRLQELCPDKSDTFSRLFASYLDGISNAFSPNKHGSNVWHFYVPLLPVWIFSEREPGTRQYVARLVWLSVIRRRLLVSMKQHPCWDYVAIERNHFYDDDIIIDAIVEEENA